MHGLKRVGETWLYVSAGVGTAAIPMRWGNPPEMPVIRLVDASDSIGEGRDAEADAEMLSRRVEVNQGMGVLRTSHAL